jgi:TolB protein
MMIFDPSRPADGTSARQIAADSVSKRRTTAPSVGMATYLHRDRAGSAKLGLIDSISSQRRSSAMRVIRRGLAAVVAASLLVTGWGAPAAAAKPAPGGRILYLEYQGSTQEVPGRLKSIRPDGSGGQDLGRDLSGAASPDYSPDGARIAYAVDFSVQSMAADGSDDRWLVDTPCGGAFPRWSPDGVWVAVETCGEIYAVHRDGHEAGWGNLTSSDGSNLTVAWAPDGRRFATGNLPGVRLYRADGTFVRLLTDLPGAYRLDWSPDGRQLAVEALGDLWLVNASNGTARRLTDTPDVQEFSPVWSPDGRWLAYGAGPGGYDPDRPGSTTNPAIWLMDRRGGDAHSTGILGVPTSWRAAA